MNNTSTHNPSDFDDGKLSDAGKERYLTTVWAKEKELTEFEKKYNIWVGEVYAWNKRAISGRDGEAVAAMIADIDNKEHGIAKGFAVRVLAHGENGFEHISMTAPIFFGKDHGVGKDQGNTEYLLGEYINGFLDDVYASPVLAVKEDTPVEFELIPIRGYKIGKQIHESSNENETGLKINDRMLAVKHYETKADEDTEFEQAMVSLASKSDEKLFDSRHPTQVFHISDLVRAADGTRVKLPEGLVIRTPQEVAENTAEAHAGCTKLNPEQFTAKVENLVERVEALERRERLSK